MRRFYMPFLIVVSIAFSVCGQKSTLQQNDKPFTIVIDAGHGGTDPGAIGSSGVKEKDIALTIAKQCQGLLTDENINVILSRNQDKFVSLNDRILLSNRKNPDIVISLHANVSKDTTKQGIDTFVNSDLQAAKMDSIFKEVFEQNALQINEMGGIANFSILKLIKAPVIYLSLGYVSNDSDCANLSDAKYRKKLAETITESILKFSKAKN